MKKIKLVYQGDSITDAGRDKRNYHQMGNGYPKYATELLNERFPDLEIEFINQGISGNRTSQLFDRLYVDALAFEPDVISILIGINDVWHRYGKNKIATFERTFIDDPDVGEEIKDPYYDLWNDPKTAEKILAEFGVDPEHGHIINGHVPVKKSKGEEPIKAGGKFINIDGGLSKAYQPVTGICGFTLVANSQTLYLAEHQPFDPTKVTAVSADMFSRVTTIEQYPERLRVKHTDGGRDVVNRIEDLKRLLEAYREGIIKPPTEHREEKV